MAFNPMKLMKIKQMWEKFDSAHPKLLPFFRAAADGYLEQGSVIEMNVTAPDGRALRCNIRLSEEDMELMREIAKM